MKIHEYQAKELFRQAGVPVLEGIVATTPEEAAAAYQKLGGSIAVVKSQIHAGGRGKGSVIDDPDQKGVVLVKSADAARDVAAGLLGNKLVTIQTGPEGQTVGKVYVEAGCDIARELYLGIVLDRAAAKPVLMVSTEGGMEIEKVAAETPDLIYKEHFDPAIGLEAFQVRKLCKKLGIQGAAAKAAFHFMRAMCSFFVKYDCSLVEINPLVITGDDQMIALDGKVTFDDNAMFRHKDLEQYRDLSEEEPSEVRASNAGLSYVKLDGNIGLPGQWCRPGDVNDGHHQVSRRRTGQLSGRWGWGRCRSSDRSVPDYLVRSELQGRVGQYLWRHRALHDDRVGTDRSQQDGWLHRALGRASGRHRSRRGPQNAGRQRRRHHQRDRLDRRGEKDRRRGRLDSIFHTFKFLKQT